MPTPAFINVFAVCHYLAVFERHTHTRKTAAASVRESVGGVHQRADAVTELAAEEICTYPVH